MDVEKISTGGGNVTAYYILLFFLLGFCNFQNATDYIFNVFLYFTPKFECSDMAFHQLLDYYRNESAILLKKNECEAQFSLKQSFSNSSRSHVTVKCTSWKYDTSVMRSTIVTEYDLVCDRGYFIQHMEAIYIFGGAIGVLLGIFGDLYGRKKILLICATWDICISVITPLVKNLYVLLLLRAIRGLSAAGAYQTLALLAELAPISRRGLVGTNFGMFWSLGYATGPAYAYFTRSWRPMLLSACVPLIIYVLFPWLVPESPRWLLSVGRTEEALKVSKEISTRFSVSDKSSLESEDKLQLQTELTDEKNMDPKPPRDKFLDIFLYPNMRMKTLSVYFIMSSISLCYNGVSLDATFGTQNIFFNCFIMGIIELPTGPFTWFLVDHTGRRISLVACLAMSALAVLAVAFLQDDQWKWMLLCVALICKFMINNCYVIGDLFAVEMFPTTVRDMGFFSMSSLSTIVACLAPYLRSLSMRGIASISYMTYAFTCTLAAFITGCFLPETRGCPLPQNIRQAERQRRGNEEEWTREVTEESKLT